MALLGCGGTQEVGLVEEVGHWVPWGVCLAPSLSCLSLLSSHHEVSSLLRPLLSLPHALPHHGPIAVEPAGRGLKTLKQSPINLPALSCSLRYSITAVENDKPRVACARSTRTHMHCQHCVLGSWWELFCWRLAWTPCLSCFLRAAAQYQGGELPWAQLTCRLSAWALRIPLSSADCGEGNNLLFRRTSHFWLWGMPCVSQHDFWAGTLFNYAKMKW